MTTIMSDHARTWPRRPRPAGRSRSACCGRTGPAQPSYWERHQVAYEPDMNVISVLQRIAAQADDDRRQATSRRSPGTATAWKKSAALARWSSTAACGRPARPWSTSCWTSNPDEIELRPMSKFPVVRDLCVDRRRLFRALEKVQGLDSGRRLLRHGPRPAAVAAEQQEQAYPLSECMSCGCCLEACPQYAQDRTRRSTTARPTTHFAARKNAAYDASFVGAHAISQAMLFNTHPDRQDQRRRAARRPDGRRAASKSAATPRTAWPSAPRRSRSPPRSAAPAAPRPSGRSRSGSTGRGSVLAPPGQLSRILTKSAIRRWPPRRRPGAGS